ncbi:glycosyltransferase [Sinorhizobium meliloti]|uniref:glycosyltransferase n=1 Tax=Rhizobium meliloti TaxID=382 RepID=UPI0012971798|nr:glycosyltransferase [Sinorhizobium meliloti]MQX24005.1 glycosyltransferase [Sinorhizobium meliloti]
MIGAPDTPRTIKSWSTVSAFAGEFLNDAELTRETCRVCFITKEFHGLFRNGGIGTANTSLAFALVEAGFDVTVALADANDSGPRSKVGNFAELKDRYGEEGLTLDYVPVGDAIPTAFDDPRSASYSVLLYLQRGNFDVVLFNDNGALGYYSLLAKHTGAFESAPTMCVVAHGPFDWVHELNLLEYYNRRPVMTGFMERQCARMADILVSPSHYMVEWMRDRGWQLPADTRVIQNLVGVGTSEPNNSSSGRQHFKEIVFFGRLEVRKGIELFCDAIDLLQRTTSLDGIMITCLGKFTQLAGIHSGVYMSERARAWQASLRLRSQYDQCEALAYLRQTGSLAVVPSPAENSPCVVSECLQLGIPFLATATGGTAELVAPEDRAACLFPPDAAALARRLHTVMIDGHNPARPAVRQDSVRSEWLALIAESGKSRQQENLQNPVPPPGRPLVSVCLAASSKAIRQTLTSVMRQTYPQLEILLLSSTNDVNLPTDLLLSDRELPIRVVAQATCSRGNARNEAARHAAGAYLFFMDENSVSLRPDCVERLVDAAARTGADILTCLQAATPGAKEPAPLAELFPIGSCSALGILENCFGSGAILVRADTFQAGHGFAGDCDDEILDWQYLASATLSGSNLELVPLPLFERCGDIVSNLDGWHLVANHRRILRTYEREAIPTVQHILEPLLEIPRRSRELAGRALIGIDQVTADKVRRLSMLDAASADANRAFCEYLCERHMVNTAIDFAFHTDFSYLPETIANAARKNATATITGPKMAPTRFPPRT